MISSCRETDPDRVAEAIAFWPWATDDAARDTLGTALGGLEASARILMPDTVDARNLANGLTEGERERVGIISDAGVDLPAFLDHLAGRSGRADLVLIAAPGELPGGWLEALRRAAAADDELAAATILVLNEDRDPFLEPMRGDEPVAGGMAVPGSVPEARVLVPWPHCTLLRRPALDLAGPFDAALTHPAVLLEEFAACALEHGLSCALVSDVFVTARSGHPGTARRNSTAGRGDTASLGGARESRGVSRRGSAASGARPVARAAPRPLGDDRCPHARARDRRNPHLRGGTRPGPRPNR